jgi:hypothetical protein
MNQSTRLPLMVAFDYVASLENTSSVQQNTRDTVQDLPRQQFVPTRSFSIRDTADKWLDPSRKSNFAQGLMSGNWFDLIVQDYVQSLSMTDPELFQTLGADDIKARSGHAYFDDLGIPCGVFVKHLGQDERGEDFFLYGILRNTTASSEEREVFVVASSEALMPYGEDCSDEDIKAQFLSFLRSKEMQTIILQSKILSPEGAVIREHIPNLKNKAYQPTTEDRNFFDELATETKQTRRWPLFLVAGLVCLGIAIASTFIFTAPIAGIFIFVGGLLAIAAFLKTVELSASNRLPEVRQQAQVEKVLAENEALGGLSSEVSLEEDSTLDTEEGLSSVSSLSESTASEPESTASPLDRLSIFTHSGLEDEQASAARPKVDQKNTPKPSS